MLTSILPHAGDPSGTIWTWALDPSVLIGIVAWLVGYILVIGPLQKKGGWLPVGGWQRFSFYSGTAILFFALVSPLDHISDEYLFSAHMIQHLLLLLVVPPLWLIGLPDGLMDRVITGRATRITRMLVNPLVAFLVFNGLVLIWHLPSLYQAALENENIHILEHLIFLIAGVWGWWPVLGRSKIAAPQAGYAVQMLYLFGMMFPMMLLAALITFAQTPIYPFYADAPRLWGLSVLADQQLASLIMWIPGNSILFIAFGVSFVKWFHEQEELALPGEDPAETVQSVDPQLTRMNSEKAHAKL